MAGMVERDAHTLRILVKVPRLKVLSKNKPCHFLVPSYYKKSWASLCRLPALRQINVLVVLHLVGSSAISLCFREPSLFSCFPGSFGVVF